MSANAFDFSKVDKQIQEARAISDARSPSKYEAALKGIAQRYPVTLQKVIGYVNQIDDGEGNREVVGEEFMFFLLQGLSGDAAIQATEERVRESVALGEQ